jgi:hypothetical protein
VIEVPTFGGGPSDTILGMTIPDKLVRANMIRLWRDGERIAVGFNFDSEPVGVGDTGVDAVQSLPRPLKRMGSRCGYPAAASNGRPARHGMP